MRTRTITVIAASVGVAVAAATGVTYASSALEAPKTAAVTKDAAPAPPRGGNGTGTNAGSNAASDAGSSDNWGGKRGDSRGENRGNWGDDRRDDLIQINERTYSAEPGSCIAVVNVTGGIGASSFNIRNDSDRTVEFFSGITCDNGAPVATVGPRSSSSSVPGQLAGVAIVGSFRVV